MTTEQIQPPRDPVEGFGKRSVKSGRLSYTSEAVNSTHPLLLPLLTFNISSNTELEQPLKLNVFLYFLLSVDPTIQDGEDYFVLFIDPPVELLV